MRVEDVHLLAYPYAMPATSSIEQPLQAKCWHMCDKMCLTAADDDDELQSQAADFEGALDLLPEAAPLAGGHSEPNETLRRDLPLLPQHRLDVQPSLAPVAPPRYGSAPSAQHRGDIAAAEATCTDCAHGVELVFEDLPAEDAAAGSGVAGWDAGPAPTLQLVDHPAACNLHSSYGADASVLPLDFSSRQHSVATNPAAARQDKGGAASNCSLPVAGSPSLADAPAVEQAFSPDVPAAGPSISWPASHTAEQPQLGWQQPALAGYPVQWPEQEHAAPCQTQALAAEGSRGQSDEDCIPIIDDDDDNDHSGCAVESAAGAIQTPSSRAVQQPPAAEQTQPPGSPSVHWLAASTPQAHNVPCGNSAAAAAAAAAAGATALPWSPTLSGIGGAQQGAAEGTLQGGTVAASPCTIEKPTPAASPQLSMSDAGGESDGGGGCEIVFDEVVAGLGSGVGVAADNPAGPWEAATGMRMAPQSGADFASMCRWLMQTSCNAASCAASASPMDTISQNSVVVCRADKPQARQERSAGSRAQGVQMLRA
jgi:hypothetical protein